jgi:hypothetical protein
MDGIHLIQCRARLSGSVLPHLIWLQPNCNWTETETCKAVISLLRQSKHSDEHQSTKRQSNGAGRECRMTPDCLRFNRVGRSTTAAYLGLGGQRFGCDLRKGTASDVDWNFIMGQIKYVQEELSPFNFSSAVICITMRYTSWWKVHKGDVRPQASWSIDIVNKVAKIWSHLLRGSYRSKAWTLIGTSLTDLNTDLQGAQWRVALHVFNESTLYPIH